MPLPPEYFQTVFLLDAPPDPLPAAFAIVTAWNPQNRATADDENRRADVRLANLLDRSGIPHFRATGCSSDFSHREPGRAAALSKRQALELGRHFKQLAIWWIEGDELVLISCRDETEHRIGSFSARVIPPPHPDTSR